jgi:ketol-acid reductoisomerase
LVSAFVAVANNRSGKAWTTARTLAAAIGISPTRQIKTTFEHEAIGDIFGEQAVLCGGLAMLIKHGFDTLVERGIPPDNAWLEVAYQLDLIVGLIKQHGISGMFDRVSVAARYGSLKSGPRVLDASVKHRMQRTLREIESGRFVRSLASLSPANLAKLRSDLGRLTSPKLEKSARKFGRRPR